MNYTLFRRRKKRIGAYSRNTMYRRKLRNLFSSWRGVSHNWFKERINEEEKLYRSALEKEMLVQWT
jgi:hypothetical protein